MSDRDVSIGSNSDFTLVKIGDMYYLKNRQTGYMLNLFQNEITYPIYGQMNNNPNSNIANVFKRVYNQTCTLNPKDNKFVPDKPVQLSKDPIMTINKPGCDYNPDKTIYLLTSDNILKSSPVRISINPNKTISIKLVRFDSYGQPNKTYQLAKCDFDVKTLKGIGQVSYPDPIGTLYVNLVCFEDESSTSTKKLDFEVEMLK
jgi:hypothetical protein